MTTPEARRPTPGARNAQADLEQSLQEIADRLNPRHLAADAAGATRQAIADAGNAVTGKGLPTDSPSRARNVKVLFAAGAATTAAVLWSTLRRRS